MIKHAVKIWKRPPAHALTDQGYVDVPPGKPGLAPIRLFYKEFCNVHSNSKQDIPTLLFLHGGPGVVDHQIYTPFWSQLASIARVIFFDMRGHGESGGRSLEYRDTWSIHQWGQDVYEFCKAREIYRPVVVGFSLGGWVAMDYIIQYPAHPSKLILCNTEAHVLVEERAKAYAARSLKQGATPEHADMIANIIRELKADRGNPETGKKYVEYCMPLFSNNPYTKEELSWCTKPNEAVWQRFDEEEYYSLDYRGKLKNIIRCPVLCIGGRDDPEHPPMGITAVAEEIGSNAELHILPGGDPIWRDCEAELLTLLHRFINS